MIGYVGMTAEQAKKCGIGVFNGELMGLHYNRKQTRQYLKEHKHDKDASYCDWCKGNTLTITDDYGDSVCELCGIVKNEGGSEK